MRLSDMPDGLALRFRRKFWGNVSAGGDDECWPWRGLISSEGYGDIAIRNDGPKYRVGAHRVSYEIHVGPIRDGRWVLHTCDVRHCVNPRHLYVGTNADNVRDRVERGRTARIFKTHCKRGHPFSPENTYTSPIGKRSCRVCRRLHSAAHRRSRVRPGGGE